MSVQEHNSLEIKHEEEKPSCGGSTARIVSHAKSEDIKSTNQVETNIKQPERANLVDSESIKIDHISQAQTPCADTKLTVCQDSNQAKIDEFVNVILTDTEITGRINTYQSN